MADCNTRWWINTRYTQACTAYKLNPSSVNAGDVERWKMMLDQHDKSCKVCKEAAK